MKSFELYADVPIVAAYDHNPERLAAFCHHWKIPTVASLQEIEIINPAFMARLICGISTLPVLFSPVVSGKRQHEQPRVLALVLKGGCISTLSVISVLWRER